MKTRTSLCVSVVVALLWAAGCRRNQPSQNPVPSPAPPAVSAAPALAPAPAVSTNASFVATAVAEAKRQMTDQGWQFGVVSNVTPEGVTYSAQAIRGEDELQARGKTEADALMALRDMAREKSGKGQPAN